MLEDEPDVDEENNITVIGWAQEIHAPTSRLQIGRDTDLFPYGEKERGVHAQITCSNSRETWISFQNCYMKRDMDREREIARENRTASGSFFNKERNKRRT